MSLACLTVWLIKDHTHTHTHTPSPGTWCFFYHYAHPVFNLCVSTFDAYLFIWCQSVPQTVLLFSTAVTFIRALKLVYVLSDSGNFIWISALVQSAEGKHEEAGWYLPHIQLSSCWTFVSSEDLTIWHTARQCPLELPHILALEVMQLITYSLVSICVVSFCHNRRLGLEDG